MPESQPPISEKKWLETRRKLDELYRQQNNLESEHALKMNALEREIQRLREELKLSENEP